MTSVAAVFEAEGIPATLVYGTRRPGMGSQGMGIGVGRLVTSLAAAGGGGRTRHFCGTLDQTRSRATTGHQKKQTNVSLLLAQARLLFAQPRHPYLRHSRTRSSAWPKWTLMKREKECVCLPLAATDQIQFHALARICILASAWRATGLRWCTPVSRHSE